MASHPLRSPAPSSWEPHRHGLALALVEARRTVGCSTRELARRARISQAYVVALEAGQRTPTVDVLARLAEALGFEPADLLARALRRRAQHVMLVVDNHQSVVTLARRLPGAVAQWVWASSEGETPAGVAHRIDLRRTPRRTYRPVDIARSLGDELERIAPRCNQQPLGLIFADTSAVMCAVPDPAVVIDFEHGWADVVDRAASEAGADAALNVCVYRLDDLRSLRDPETATLDIIRGHDTVWSTHGRRLVEGDEATRRLLQLVGAA